jgi:hypothetical protein
MAGLEKDELERRWHAIRDALANTVDEERKLEIERVRQEDLDPKKVQEFTEAVEANWRGHRVLPGLLRVALAPPADGDVQSPQQIRRWLPKIWFVPSGRVIGLDFTGGDIGRGIVGREMDILVRLAAEVETWRESGALLSRIRGARRALADGGYAASLLLLPVKYQLLEQLGLSILMRSADWRIVSAVPKDAVHWFHGNVDDLPVVAWPAVPDDRLYIIDAARFCTWRLGSEDTLALNLKSFDEEQAFRFAEGHPEAFEEPDASVAARANVVRDQVLLEGRDEVELRLADVHAELISQAEE